MTGVPTADAMCPGGAATGCPTGVPYMPKPGAIWPCTLCFSDCPTPIVLEETVLLCCPVIGAWLLATSPLFTLVMSWILDLLLSLFIEFNLMKYFCAWLATWVGVLDITKFLEMLLQSPFPNLSRPSKNNLKSKTSKKSLDLCTSSSLELILLELNQIELIWVSDVWSILLWELKSYGKCVWKVPVLLLSPWNSFSPFLFWWPWQGSFTSAVSGGVMS